jgi:hypothetical protein
MRSPAGPPLFKDDRAGARRVHRVPLWPPDLRVWRSGLKVVAPGDADASARACP